MEMIGQPRVTLADGTAIAWTELGSGPPLVLLHGLGDSHRTWRRVAPRLGRHFRVLMPDLPGHGLSGRPDAPYTLEWYARTMASWLDQVGLERAHVIGHSFGGGVAQWMLLDHRARIDRMALVAAGGLGDEVGVGLRLAAFPILGPLLAPPLMKIGTRALMHMASEDFARPEPEEIDRIAWMNAAPGSARAFTRTVGGCIDLFGQTMSTWRRIHEVQTLPPIALFWGERDRIIPVSHGYQAFERIEGATFTPYEGCGHFPHLERSERFGEEVARFLDDSIAHPRPRVRLLPVPYRRESGVKRFFLRIGSALRTALRTLAA
jgi:pimeloyl-ACP methyl ester carboxylesterase